MSAAMNLQKITDVQQLADLPVGTVLHYGEEVDGMFVDAYALFEKREDETWINTHDDIFPGLVHNEDFPVHDDSFGGAIAIGKLSLVIAAIEEEVA